MCFRTERMKPKIEIKEEVDEDSDNKMEVLRILKTNPKLHLSPQETPVDLTTNGKMCPSSILHPLAYPHLRFYSKESPKQEIESYFANNSRSVDVKEFKENKFSDDMKKEAVSSLEYKPSSKKRRLQEDYLDIKAHSAKKQKLESDHLQETFSFESSVRSERNLKENTDSPYQFNRQCFPYYYFDHSALMERIKATNLTNVHPSSLQETETLLAAVQHSQMLYYSYCSKLFQNLQSKRLSDEQELAFKHLGDNLSTSNKDKKRIDLSRSETKKSLKTTSKLKQDLPAKSNFQNSLTEENCSPQGCSYQSPYVPPIAFSPIVQPQIYVGSPLAYPGPQSPNSLNGNETDSSPSKEDSKGTIGRKRAPRALTGKHVRQGTGASLSTLQTLRQKLEERQRVRRAQSVTTDEENTSVGD